MVHYPDPGPRGGTSGQQVRSCPNHQNANIRFIEIKESKKFKKKRKFRCDSCSQEFSKRKHLIFMETERTSQRNRRV
jgi:hypothetical protein